MSRNLLIVIVSLIAVAWSVINVLTDIFSTIKP